MIVDHTPVSSQETATSVPVKTKLVAKNGIAKHEAAKSGVAKSGTAKSGTIGISMMLLIMGGLTACNATSQSMVAAPEIAATSEAQSLANIKDVLDASAEEVPTLTAVGYAVVSSQPGRTDAQKRLMAIRSARMAAMRDLAEQIHGLQIDSSTTVIDLMVQNDTFRGVVSGTIRGARTVRINPTGSDTYEIVLEIDRDLIAHLMNNAKQIG